jgi:hypothetical protein
MRTNVWTDRQIGMTKLIVAFRNFANVHKNTEIDVSMSWIFR